MEREIGQKIEEEDDEDSPNDDEEEEDYLDNEYHEEEKAVAGRLNPYSIADETHQILTNDPIVAGGARKKLGANAYFQGTKKSTNEGSFVEAKPKKHHENQGTKL